MTAAGVPATDDSGREACDCGHAETEHGEEGCYAILFDPQRLGRYCDCREQPTPVRPGTAELREEIAEIIFGAPRQYRLHSDTNFRRWGGAVTKADAVLATDGVQRLLAVEQRVRRLANELEEDAQRQVDLYPATSDALPAVVGRSWVNAARQFRRALGGGDDA